MDPSGAPAATAAEPPAPGGAPLPGGSSEAPGQAPRDGPSVWAYVEALASKAPAPGGGSATGLVGAMGAALVSMVANFTVGRKKYAAVEARAQAALREAEQARAELLRLMEEDERAYTALAAARRRPRATDEEKRARSQATQQALRGAAAPPLAMAAVCRRTLDLAGIVAEAGNANLASDAGVAALLAEAALRASAINVRVNLALVEDRAFVAETEARLNELLDGTPSLKEEVLAVAGRRMVGGE